MLVVLRLQAVMHCANLRKSIQCTSKVLVCYCPTDDCSDKDPSPPLFYDLGGSNHFGVDIVVFVSGCFLTVRGPVCSTGRTAHTPLAYFGSPPTWWPWSAEYSSPSPKQKKKHDWLNQRLHIVKKRFHERTGAHTWMKRGRSRAFSIPSAMWKTSRMESSWQRLITKPTE